MEKFWTRASDMACAPFLLEVSVCRASVPQATAEMSCLFGWRLRGPEELLVAVAKTLDLAGGPSPVRSARNEFGELALGCSPLLEDITDRVGADRRVWRALDLRKSHPESRIRRFDREGDTDGRPVRPSQASGSDKERRAACLPLCLQRRLVSVDRRLDGEAIRWGCTQLHERQTEKLEGRFIGIVVPPVGADRDDCFGRWIRCHVASTARRASGANRCRAASWWILHRTDTLGGNR